MKKEHNRTAITRLSGICVLVIATLASPEALAQGGRTSQGRSGTSTQVERKKVSRQKTAAKEKSAATVQRRARVVETPKDNRPTSVGRTAGRTVRRGNTAATDNRNRDQKSRVVERKSNRSGRGTSTVTKRDRNRTERTNRRVLESRNDRKIVNRRGDRDGYRSRYTGPRFDGAKSVKHLYTKRDRFYFHNRRHLSSYGWCTAYHPAGHYHYVNARVHIGSHIYLGVSWPWAIRFESHWRPRFRYRQVVYIDAGWNGRRIRNKVEVHTYYRHRVLFANDQYSEVEVEVSAVDLYQNGRFLATVDRIPGSLSKMRAVIYADGRIEFDRNLFVIGDATAGFELIATRYYTDHLYNAYDPGHGYKVGRVDLRRGKVKKVGYSRFFDRGRFSGYAPVSLLPDDDRLWDYGRPVSYRYDDSDRDDWYRDYRGYEATGYEGEYELSRDFLDNYSTDDGADIRLERATVLERLD